MKLTVYERVALLQVLPAVHRKSSFLKLKTLRSLIDEIGFSEQELTDWEIVHKDKQIKWDHGAAEDKAIELGPVATELVMGGLRWLDENERLDFALMGLCEKFGYSGADDAARQTSFPRDKAGVE